MTHSARCKRCNLPKPLDTHWLCAVCRTSERNRFWTVGVTVLCGIDALAVALWPAMVVDWPGLTRMPLGMGGTLLLLFAGQEWFKTSGLYDLDRGDE